MQQILLRYFPEGAFNLQKDFNIVDFDAVREQESVKEWVSKKERER